jgi:hypothetical protein
MVELELIYLGRISVKAVEPVRVSLESVYANGWARIRDDFPEYAQHCAKNGLTAAVKLFAIDLVAFTARLAIFSEKEGEMFPTLMPGDGRIIDWNARGANLEAASLPDRTAEMKARVAAAESALGSCVRRR